MFIFISANPISAARERTSKKSRRNSPAPRHTRPRPIFRGRSMHLITNKRGNEEKSKMKKKRSARELLRNSISGVGWRAGRTLGRISPSNHVAVIKKSVINSGSFRDARYILIRAPLRPSGTRGRRRGANTDRLVERTEERRKRGGEREKEIGARRSLFIAWHRASADAQREPGE